VAATVAATAKAMTTATESAAHAAATEAAASAETAHATASEARVHMRNRLHRPALGRWKATCRATPTLEPWRDRRIARHSHPVRAALDGIPAAIRIGRIYRIVRARRQVARYSHPIRAALEGIPAAIGIGRIYRIVRARG
jgi:hypothetical protein